MDPIAKKTTKAERWVKQQATPKGVVIREPTFPSPSRSTLSNTKQEYVVNGKAPITEVYSESSDDEDETSMVSEKPNMAKSLCPNPAQYEGHVFITQSKLPVFRICEDPVVGSS
ncbi:hypothetical protein LguiA_002773 [Lonicera macranthoides]